MQMKLYENINVRLGEIDRPSTVFIAFGSITLRSCAQIYGHEASSRLKSFDPQWPIICSDGVAIKVVPRNSDVDSTGIINHLVLEKGLGVPICSSRENTVKSLEEVFPLYKRILFAIRVVPDNIREHCNFPQ